MKIEDQLKGLPEKFIVLVVVSSDKFQQTSMQLLDVLTKRYKGGGYITVNKPYQSMTKLLKNNNISERNVFFIDCVTAYLREKNAISKNCYFVDSPADLTEISIALDPILKDDVHQFLMVDSLDILKVYNNYESVIKFAHFLTGKLRMHDMSGVLLAVEEKSEEKLIHEWDSSATR